VGCKKDQEVKKLDSIEIKFINFDDSNLKSIYVKCELFDYAGQPNGGSFNNIYNISLQDTITIIISNNNADYMNSIRKKKIKLGFRNKVYSPLLAAMNLIIDGNPYAPGWHYNRWYVPIDDTVNDLSKRVYYIRWPDDSISMREMLW
jgi:hypothetical protein